MIGAILVLDKTVTIKLFCALDTVLSNPKTIKFIAEIRMEWCMDMLLEAVFKCIDAPKIENLSDRIHLGNDEHM